MTTMAKTVLEMNGKRYKAVPDTKGVNSCAANGCALWDYCSPSDILCEEFMTDRAVHFEEDGDSQQCS